MPTANKFVDDFSRVFSGAAGVAKGARGEAEAAMKSWMQKMVAEQGFVKRDEFEAVAEMAKKVRVQNDEMQKEIDALKKQIESLSKSKAKK